MSETKHTPGPLPERWKLKSGILTDHEGVERYVLDGNGKIDRMKVSIIFDNYDFGYHSRAWIMTPLEAAAPELLEGLQRALTCLEFAMAELGRLDSFTASAGYSEAKAAIAKAEGK